MQKLKGGNASGFFKEEQGGQCVREEGSGARRANEGFGLPSEEDGMPLGAFEKE